MRIDVQTHHVPQAYVEALAARSDFPRYEKAEDFWWAWASPDEKLPMRSPALDISIKLAEMDEQEIDIALISMNIPGPDLAKSPQDADELARIGNDGLAEAAARHPGRFRGVASLGFGDMDATCRELERCVDELGFVGLQVFSYIGGRRYIDDPANEPLWGLLAERGVPLVLHPGPSPSGPQYKDHWLGPMIGFMFDECLAALRLILSGVLERHPNLKLLLPHGGASLPFFIGRVDNLSSRYRDDQDLITRDPSEYFARFHTDTVVHSQTALEFSLKEMGASRMMFASDAPWVPVKRHADMMDALDISAEDAERIWSGTAREFFGL